MSTSVLYDFPDPQIGRTQLRNCCRDVRCTVKAAAYLAGELGVRLPNQCQSKDTWYYKSSFGLPFNS